MFAALSTNPDFYKDKIKCFIAIAPVTRLETIASKIVIASNNFIVKKMID